MIPPAGYMAGVAELCRKHGIVFIADEVMAGFGRSGKWLAMEHFDTVPDLITFAKGVTSGYVPLGGVMISNEIAATFDDKVYFGGLTYSGHPLACAAAVATIGAMREEGMVENAARFGEEIIGPRLAKLLANHEVVGEVRGVGAFWAVEFVADRETRAPLGADGMNAIAGACKERGYLPFVAGNRIHVVPPLNISDTDLEDGLARLDEAIGTV